MFETKNFRIIDLSSEIHPGILKINGDYLHGNQTRRFELRQFVYAPDKMFMN